jgi:hypothetical protein
VNTRKASGEILGSAAGSLLGGAFGKNLGPRVIASAVLMTATGVLATFGALAAKPERLASAQAPPAGIPFCHSSANAAAGAGALIRLAASRTEVPTRKSRQRRRIPPLRTSSRHCGTVWAR